MQEWEVTFTTSLPFYLVSVSLYHYKKLHRSYQIVVLKSKSNFHPCFYVCEIYFFYRIIHIYIYIYIRNHKCTIKLNNGEGNRIKNLFFKFSRQILVHVKHISYFSRM